METPQVRGSASDVPPRQGTMYHVRPTAIVTISSFVSMNVLYSISMVVTPGLLRTNWPLSQLHLEDLVFRSSKAAGRRQRPLPSPFSTHMALDPDNPTTLLVGSQQDRASCAMIDALLSRGDWLETNPGIEPSGKRAGRAWNHARSPTSMWAVEGGLLDLNDVDRRWVDTLEVSRKLPSDVIFLSKHVAKSGVPALCVHPIGVPNPAAFNEAGGKPGRCPPPSPRLAGCLRELVRATRDAGLDSSFDVTLEVTHHGPWLNTPAMFVEIGSNEEHWGRADAAEVWADVLTRMLGLDGSSGIENWALLDPAARADRAVFIGLGGGHYAPKFGDLARLEGRYIGHMLASYTLDFSEEGLWRDALSEAVRSTRAAFPGARGGVAGGVAALVDKKAFRAADRSALLKHLDSLGVEYRFKSSEC